MLIVLVINSLIVLGLLLAGITVLFRDAKPVLNRLFFAFVVALSTWIIANFFSNNFTITYNQALLANHLTLFASGVVLILLLLFSILLSGKKVSPPVIAGITILFIIYSLSLTKWVFESIVRQDNVYAINFTNLGGLYFLAIFINIIAVIFVLLKGRKNATGIQKDRINTFLWGVGILIGINVATNALLPVLGNQYALTSFGPLSGVVVVYTLWLSIVKHRLFDIQLVVARSMAYVLSIAVLVGVYFLASFLVINNLITDSTDNLLYEIATASLLVVGALLFAPIKKYFDRLTNKVFYRDGYDSEAFLAEVNKIVVSNVDADMLLKRVSNVITDRLKTEFTLFGLYKTSYVERRMVGVGDTTLDQEGFADLAGFMGTHTDRVLATLDLSPEMIDLKHILQGHDIEVVAKLNPFAELDSPGYGLLLLGPKKSGNQYSKQDLAVIRIIAGELSIAVQNALRFEEIEKFNVTLQQRVNDATRKLRRNNEKLEAMDETKDEFISMASHQLRTPLTSVKGYVSMVLEGDAGPINDMQRKLLEQAFTSSQRMVFLIADLLNLSRLRTGKFVIEATPTNLADVIEGEVAQLKDTALSRSLELKYNKPHSFPTLMLDETKIRQVIMNFVDNAIYYTPSGGEIEIRLTETEKAVEFTVRDNGIGVPKHEQHHLFNKFYRAKNAQKARPDGTGLGLFMAKKVVVAQGGAIVFSSTEGKGSVFGFTFSKDKLAVTEED